MSLNCNETRILIDTNVNINSAFITVKNSSDDEVFTISELKCVYKLLYVLRDILPNGTSINKDELSIVSALIECVKTCPDTERQIYSELRPECVAREILKEDPSLYRFKVKQLLRVNRIDLLCIANLNPFLRNCF